MLWYLFNTIIKINPILITPSNVINQYNLRLIGFNTNIIQVKMNNAKKKGHWEVNNPTKLRNIYIIPKQDLNTTNLVSSSSSSFFFERSSISTHFLPSETLDASMITPSTTNRK
jgi:hypothetical protein